MCGFVIHDFFLVPTLVEEAQLFALLEQLPAGHDVDREGGDYADPVEFPLASAMCVMG